MSVDPDNLLPDQSRLEFQQLLEGCDRVFDPKITGYNGAASPIQAIVNMVMMAQFCPSAKRTHPAVLFFVELQAMFDELEQAKVFRRPRGS